ncbi:MAG: hypothetical protein EOP00_00720 [Pedobacter sp.]|nr:MAG: hypothetical protein EOP00_00720 [Pedobacter sp.]
MKKTKKDLNQSSNDLLATKEIEEKLFNLQKNILNLKLVKASRKVFNYHIIKATKLEIVKLHYTKSLLKNT